MSKATKKAPATAPTKTPATAPTKAPAKAPVKEVKINDAIDSIIDRINKKLDTNDRAIQIALDHLVEAKKLIIE